MPETATGPLSDEELRKLDQAHTDLACLEDAYGKGHPFFEDKFRDIAFAAVPRLIAELRLRRRQQPLLYPEGQHDTWPT